MIHAGILFANDHYVGRRMSFIQKVEKQNLPEQVPECKKKKKKKPI